MESHVFMHLGTTPGQAAGTTDEVGSAGVKLTGLVVMALVSVEDVHTVVDKL
jgi:hypothetical protein